MVKATNIMTLIGFSTLFLSCDVMRGVEQRAAELNSYEKKSLVLAKENRELKNEVSSLQYQVKQLENEISFLKLQLSENKEGKRDIASVMPGKAKAAPVVPAEDMVKFEIYKWSAADLLRTAEKEFQAKNFTKSSQFYAALIKNYPGFSGLDDITLFQAGLSSFEAGYNYNLALDQFELLLKKYPTSKFYRGAKLWSALSYLKVGKKDEFFQTVEEFRQKYRNTPEWKILSEKYEEIVDKYKN
jgi:TolA-binding protein